MDDAEETCVHSVFDLDELLLHVLDVLPETAWKHCASVCARWATLVAHNRTQLVVSLEDAPPHRLVHALHVLERSTRPFSELRLSGLSELAPDEAHVVELAVARSAPHLAALALSGRTGRWLRPSNTLDATLRLLISAPRVALRRLDLGWSSAMTAESLLALLQRHGREDEPLIALRLDGCQWLDRCHDGLRACAPWLQELSIVACEGLDAAGVAALCQACTRLTSLDLCRVLLTRHALDALLGDGLGERLTTLGLSGHTQLPSQSFAHVLASCPRLTDFDFSFSLLNDSAFEDALSSRVWAAARMHDCSGLGDEGVRRLCLAGGGTLHTLRLGGAFTRLGAAAASHIGALAALAHLELPFVALGMDGVAALRPVAAQLTHLDLSNSPKLTEAALREMLSLRAGPAGTGGCGALLRALHLRGCDESVTDAVLGGWWPRALGLRVLDVAECTALSDITAMLIAGSYARRGPRRPLLRRLDIRGCSGFSSRGRGKLHAAQAAELYIQDDERAAERALPSSWMVDSFSTRVSLGQ
jgi:hypothetical protein